MLPFASRDGHPRFFGFVPCSGTWPGALGDLITSACNFYVGSWMESAGPSQVELEVLGWFKEWIGYPSRAAGSLVSGGSAGNMSAIACALETVAGPMRDDLVLYVSGQAHLGRAGGADPWLPAGPGACAAGRCGVPAGSATLRRAMDAGVAAGARPSWRRTGATNSGAVDPLPQLAEVCREREPGCTWTPPTAVRGPADRELLPAELADSVTLDPHKDSAGPSSAAVCSCERTALRPPSRSSRTTSGTPRPPTRRSIFRPGIQLTRSHALKLWLAALFGVDAFRTAIRRSLTWPRCGGRSRTAKRWS